VSNETGISRRGLFMKIGILFNGVVATALAVPIVQYVASSISRSRASGYLSWVSLGRVREFPEGETRLATFRNPYVMPTARPPTRPAGSGGSRASSSRSLPSTARIWDVRSAGSRSRASSCVRATAVPTTATARVPRGRQSAGCSNIRSRFKTARSPFTPESCPHQVPPPLRLRRTSRPLREIQGNRHAPDREDRRVV
jgi:hypothetical protein